MLAAGKVKTIEDLLSFAEVEDEDLDEITAGSFTHHKRSGNKEPTFEETGPGSGSYFNSVGLRNGGLKYLKANIDSMIDAAGAKRLRISVAPLEPDDLSVLIAFLSNYPVVTLEVNTSCPNVWHDGVQKPLICHTVAAFERTLRVVVKVRDDLRTAVKISALPDAIRQDIVEWCHFLGVDEIVLINTRPNVPAIDKDGKRLLSVPLAGLSGRAIQEEALEEVRKTREVLSSIAGASMRLVGCGGIDSPGMVRRMEEAGANAVQIGSYAFINGPKIFKELRAA
jgi:dihydroorotate dehydrogenase